MYSFIQLKVNGAACNYNGLTVSRHLESDGVSGDTGWASANELPPPAFSNFRSRRLQLRLGPALTTGVVHKQ